MDAHESWTCQGRQYHGWFGYGTCPDGGSKSSAGLGDFGSRAEAVARGAAAALPPALRKPFSARLDRKAVARLKKLMMAWMGAARFDDATFAERFFGRHGDDPVVAKLRSAVRRADLATRHSELGEAATDLAVAIQLVGLDRWPRFLEDAERRADDPATIAAVEKSQHPAPIGKDAIRPVYPIENLLGMAATGVAGRAVAPAARAAAGTILRQLMPRTTALAEEAGSAGTILPNAKRAIIDPRKLLDYALDPGHAEKGADKAKVFRAALGMTKANADDLMAQIKSGIQKIPAVVRPPSEHGRLFAVDMPITGPTGSAMVRTLWIIEHGKKIPRLVSLYVRRKK